MTGEKSKSSKDEEEKSPSRWTLYRAKRKVQQIMPNTPIKKAAIVEELVESPRTANILSKKGVIIGKETKKHLDMATGFVEGIKSHITEVKPTGTQEQDKKSAYEIAVNTALKSSKKKYKLKSLKTLGLCKNKKMKDGENWWRVNPRKKRKDRTTDEVKEKVREFYLSQEISRELPNKKDVLCIKEGNEKEYVQKHVMTMTTADAFQVYKSKYSDDKIGFSTFKKLKPTQVRRVSETSRKSCLCQACCNVALKSEALKTYLKTENFKDLETSTLKTDKYEVMQMTLCPKNPEENYKNDCLNRACSHCGTDPIKEHYNEVNIKSNDDNLIMKWYKWEYVNVEREDSPPKRIISCVLKSTTFDEFLTDYQKDLKEYPVHKFRASWQHEQLTKCLASLKNHELMMVMDFSENYKCSFQNEVQSAYFDQNLVTIHPSMNYYKKNVDDKDVLVKHSIIGISDDLKHDSNLVKVFENKTLDIIEKEIAVESVNQWSDGCAAQYKSKLGFAYLSERNYKMTRHFFETSHGKNVCDGLGAIVTNACYRAMLTGKVIGNSADLYSYCSESLSHGLKLNKKENTATVREFIFVSKDEADRQNIPKVETLIGTRKIHSVRNTGGANGCREQKPVLFLPGMSCYWSM